MFYQYSGPFLWASEARLLQDKLEETCTNVHLPFIILETMSVLVCFNDAGMQSSSLSVVSLITHALVWGIEINECLKYPLRVQSPRSDEAILMSCERQIVTQHTFQNDMPRILAAASTVPALFIFSSNWWGEVCGLCGTCSALFRSTDSVRTCFFMGCQKPIVFLWRITPHRLKSGSCCPFIYLAATLTWAAPKCQKIFIVLAQDPDLYLSSGALPPPCWHKWSKLSITDVLNDSRSLCISCAKIS